MIRSDRRRLHPDDVPLWLAVEAAVFRLARHVDTRINWVRPMKKADIQFWWGMYHGYPERGIEITLREWDAKRGWDVKPQKCYQLVDVIAHEVAHAKVGIPASHGNRWIKAYAHCLYTAAVLNLRLDLLKSGAKFPSE